MRILTWRMRLSGRKLCPSNMKRTPSKERWSGPLAKPRTNDGRSQSDGIYTDEWVLSALGGYFGDASGIGSSWRSRGDLDEPRGTV